MRHTRRAWLCPSAPVSCWRCCRSREAYRQSVQAGTGGPTRHWRRFLGPADPAFNSGLRFFGLADFVEAAVFSGNAEAARGVIDEMERISAPMPVPWVETMLHYGKALLAVPED